MHASQGGHLGGLLASKELPLKKPSLVHHTTCLNGYHFGGEGEILLSKAVYPEMFWEVFYTTFKEASLLFLLCFVCLSNWHWCQQCQLESWKVVVWKVLKSYFVSFFCFVWCTPPFPPRVRVMELVLAGVTSRGLGFLVCCKKYFIMELDSSSTGSVSVSLSPFPGSVPGVFPINLEVPS